LTPFIPRSASNRVIDRSSGDGVSFDKIHIVAVDAKSRYAPIAEKEVGPKAASRPRDRFL
jgi:hypothetical protein